MITIQSKMKYYDGDIVVSLTKYLDGTTAIIFNEPNGAPLAKASVNMTEHLPDELIPVPHEITFIKDYSENEGVLDTLLDADLVETVGIPVSTGHVTVQAVKIKEELLNG